ncbi:unnamed protein product [Mytilus edulis]|uniref:Uncharacterized protein n=1 Tax=Mytilus edulis TaxID=6550 RepID=A0A8S3UNA2_MYTED|nr:unnamed protein product [Mytilus edulis]
MSFEVYLLYITGCVNASYIEQLASTQSTASSKEDATQTRITLLETLDKHKLTNPTTMRNDKYGLGEKSSSSSVSVKSVNNSYLSFHESYQNSHSDQSQGDDDTTSYLHPYHTNNEDWKEKTHQYEVAHVQHKESDDSSDSSTQMINDGYLHPYQPLKEGWKQLSHSYEAP